MDKMGATKDEIPTKGLVAKWNHLSKIVNDFPSFIPDARIGLLIGSNCPKAIEPKDLIVSEDGGPFAIRTFAGWTVVGSQSRPQDCINVSCHRISVEEIVAGKPFRHHFVLESRVKEILTPQTLNKMFELDFNERSCEMEHGHSIQDKEFLKNMMEECEFKNGHYQLPLPLVDGGKACLPNNRVMANQRLESLRKKLLRNPGFHEDCINFMNSFFLHGCARKAPAVRDSVNGKIWYLPHHGVYYPK